MTTDDNHNKVDAIIDFLRRFPSVSVHVSDIPDLCDGVALFEALSEIAPAYFDPTTITHEIGDNWALRSTNLRKLIRNLETYFHEVLRKDADFSSCMSEIPTIARNGSSNDSSSSSSSHSLLDSISSIFELMAAAAVSCENRATFIERMLSMDKKDQIVMKEIVERSLARLADYEGDDAMYHNTELIFEDTSYMVSEEKEEVGSPLLSPLSSNLFSPHAIDDSLFLEGGTRAVPVIDGSNDYASVLQERDELRRLLSQVRRESEATHQESEHLQSRLRIVVEDYDQRLSRKDQELQKLKQELARCQMLLAEREANLTEANAKNASLADELDVVNAKTEQLHKAEAKVVSYRKRLEDMGGLNQQMAELETQAERYLQQIIDLESSNKKLPVLEGKVEELQKKLTIAEQQNMRNEEKLERKSADIQRFQNDLSETERRGNMYKSELFELKKQHEASNLAEDDDMNLGKELSLTSSMSISETKEKAIRLERENKSLKEEIENLRQEKPVTMSAAGEDSSSGDIIMKPTPAATLSSTTAKESALLLELKGVKEEREKLRKERDKLEGYTKRALNKFQEKYLQALNECKQKLKEKNDTIETLTSKLETQKTVQKREERLLTSAMYELGLTIMQNNLKDRR